MAFDVGSVVAHIKADLTGFNEGMDKARGSVNNLGSTVTKVTAGFADFSKQAMILTGVVATGVVAFGKVSVDAYKEAEAAQAQLEHAVIDVTHATKDQLAATMELATQLQNKGVLDDDAIKTGLAQLSTFGLSNKAVRGLGGSLADLAVNQFGVNAGGQELSQTANMIAKALNGQFGVLEKSGIRFTAAQKAIIATGTEMEKVKAINEGFAQNLKYTNEVALTTLEGKLAAVSVKFGNFKEAVGGALVEIGKFMVTGDDSKGGLFDSINALIPDDDTAERLTNFIIAFREALVKIGEWISENQQLVLTFLQGLAIALGALLVLGTITALITALSNPLVLAALAIGALFTAFQTNFLGIHDIVMSVVGVIVDVFNNILMPVVNALTKFIVDHWQFISMTTDAIWHVILGIIQVVWGIIYTFLSIGMAILTGDWQKAWENIKHGIGIAWDGIKNIFSGALDFIVGWGGKLIGILTKPFEDAWHAIENTVNKIKDALDFTKRHSPSVVDIVTRGVGLVNDALSDLAVNPTVNAGAMAASIGAVGSSAGINNISLQINLDGAIIADDFSANRISEKIGNQIIRKLQQNVRF